MPTAGAAADGRAGNPNVGRRAGSRAVGVAAWVVGFAGIALALRSSLDEHSGPLRPTWPAFATAFVLLAGGHVCGSIAWMRCFGAPDPNLARAYYGSQLGKYLPGGIWQAASQISMARHGREPRVIVAAYISSQLTFLATGTVLGGLGCLLTTGSPLWLRVGAGLAAGAAVFLLWRPTAAWLLARLPHVTRRARWGIDPDALPPQAAINRCAGWSAGKLLLHGASFAIVLQSIEPSVSGAAAWSAFVLAWMVGLVCIPVPSGIGIREGVVVLVLGGGVPATAPLLAAHVGHRVPTLVAEASLAIGSWRGRARVDRA